MADSRKLYDVNLPHRTRRHAEISSRYEMLYAANDFIAGITFVLGSILFFYESGQYLGTWLFLVGSILFTLRPAIRLVRNIHLLRMPHNGVPSES